MSRRGTTLPTTAVVMLSALFFVATAYGGSTYSQSNFGVTFFDSSPPCPVRDFPTFESIAPIPAILDPFDQDLIPIFCQIQVERRGNGVNKAKGTYTSELIVRDNTTGELETFPLGSGKFKTNESGFGDFDFEIPTEIFADGFESGDVSAWSYTRADFTNKKKADRTSVSCNKGASGSN